MVCLEAQRWQQTTPWCYSPTDSPRSPQVDPTESSGNLSSDVSALKTMSWFLKNSEFYNIEGILGISWQFFLSLLLPRNNDEIVLSGVLERYLLAINCTSCNAKMYVFLYLYLPVHVATWTLPISVCVSGRLLHSAQCSVATQSVWEAYWAQLTEAGPLRTGPATSSLILKLIRNWNNNATLQPDSSTR